MTRSANAIVRVRRLEPADWPELKAVRLAALADAPYAFSSTLERERDFPDQRWQDWPRSALVFGAFTLAGTDDSQAGPIVGMAAGYGPAGPGPDAGGAGPGPWHLVSMWVNPVARGLGVGDQLVSAVCEHARQAGASTLTLWVTDINGRARAFYDRLGFAPTGSRQLVRPDSPDHWETELARRLH
jgi:ribosomal protein S18 acetylase RimI-like enzyme